MQKSLPQKNAAGFKLSKNYRFLTEKTRLLKSCGISGRRRDEEDIFDRKRKRLLLQKCPFSPHMSLKMIKNERAAALSNSPKPLLPV